MQMFTLKPEDIERLPEQEKAAIQQLVSLIQYLWKDGPEFLISMLLASDLHQYYGRWWWVTRIVHIQHLTPLDSAVPTYILTYILDVSLRA